MNFWEEINYCYLFVTMAMEKFPGYYRLINQKCAEYEMHKQNQTLLLLLSSCNYIKGFPPN